MHDYLRLNIKNTYTKFRFEVINFFTKVGTKYYFLSHYSFDQIVLFYNFITTQEIRHTLNFSASDIRITPLFESDVTIKFKHFYQTIMKKSAVR